MEKTVEQLRSIFGMCKQLRIDSENRAEMIIEVTDGRSSSAKDLSYHEAKELIRHLNTIAEGNGKGWNTKQWRMDKMRKKILSFFHEMGYAQGGKLDMEKVNAQIEKLGYKKKPLNQYHYEELPKLVTQFENIRNSYLKAIS